LLTPLEQHQQLLGALVVTSTCQSVRATLRAAEAAVVPLKALILPRHHPQTDGHNRGLVLKIPSTLHRFGNHHLPQLLTQLLPATPATRIPLAMQVAAGTAWVHCENQQLTGRDFLVQQQARDQLLVSAPQQQLARDQLLVSAPQLWPVHPQASPLFSRPASTVAYHDHRCLRHSPQMRSLAKVILDVG
jgi:hypothetical protein